MLTAVAVIKSAATPLALGLLLAKLLRRSAKAWVLLAAFAAGGLGAFSINSSILRNLPSMLPPGQLHANTAPQAWLSAFVEAAIPEELAKGIWVLVFLVGWRQYTRSHGGLIGSLIGLGFAFRENLAFAQTAPEWRVMGAFSHGAWGVILGSLLERAICRTRVRVLAVAAAFLPTILLHGLIDGSIFLVEAFEAETGLNPETADPAAVVRPRLLMEMALTLAIDALSIAWAVRWIRQIRRIPGRVERNDSTVV